MSEQLAHANYGCGEKWAQKAEKLILFFFSPGLVCDFFIGVHSQLPQRDLISSDYNACRFNLLDQWEENLIPGNGMGLSVKIGRRHIALDAPGLLCLKGTSRAHVQPIVHQDCQVCFCKADFQSIFSQHILVHGVTPFQVRDFAFPLVTFHEAPVRPYLQPVKVSVRVAQPPGVSANLPNFVSSVNLSRGNNGVAKYSIIKFSFALEALSESRILPGGLRRKSVCWLQYNSIA
ncbi:hypothetical protein WISP_41968 [Willisornis vidua]|uniref:Uncharacterized protein n=1 Tax=Willisornis vidua TaxID=1566151 RepID=A0ABQ9DGI0_9PASS|nr:hypothetical protein WISP_41968 [Willisornis vidua]